MQSAEFMTVFSNQNRSASALCTSAHRSGDDPMNIQNPTPTQGYPITSLLPAHRAEELTKGGNLAHIELGDQLYTLRITRAGKLILTK
jgi:hemin uptake protein HemP